MSWEHAGSEQVVLPYCHFSEELVTLGHSTFRHVTSYRPSTIPNTASSRSCMLYVADDIGFIDVLLCYLERLQKRVVITVLVCPVLYIRLL